MRKTLLFLGLILALVCVNAHAENHELSTNCNVTSMASDRAQDDGPYTIGVTSNPTIGGTTTGAGDYESGQTCTLTATPNQGYVFANWTENGVPQTNNPVYSFTVIENRELVATSSHRPTISRLMPTRISVVRWWAQEPMDTCRHAP